MMKALFKLGAVYTTRGARQLMKEQHINPVALLTRHVSGDWGDLDEADKKENELSLLEGFRILSAYGKGQEKLYVITEADRSITTILCPEEY
jgi:hypothetical protein